ncbi:homologous-pairing protein-like protein 2 [Lophiotrema nucula]|uniref:Homologous-pairing protein-like protein 2 n=1 Tax=Lophiotrema nucula TaxID=690887 RepID=A0A6A5ZU20_9PLEO|nr:homologous-pairing protein-like protein 2 [Lophiotrema nucula]
MAPRKEKAEKVSVNDQVDMVLNYLRKQNRPYSATDISANLHNKVTKAAAAKILKDLHEKNDIAGCQAGKQIVYHAIQSAEDSCTPEQLAEMDSRINELRTSTSALQAEAKTLRSTLSSLNNTLSTADLISSVQAFEAQRSSIQARLDTLKAGKVKNVTKKEREEIEKEWSKWKSAGGRRQEIAREMWHLVQDVLPDGTDEGEFRESLGLDD